MNERPEPTRCPEPIFQSSGVLYATRWGEHNWRLDSRHPIAGGHWEVWYCTKCRRVEEYAAPLPQEAQ